MTRSTVLLGWALLTPLLPAALIMLAPNQAGDLVLSALLNLPYPHGTVKFVLESSQGALLRVDRLAWGLPLTALLSVLVLALPRLRGLWLLAMGALALWLPFYSPIGLLLFLGLTGFAWMPERWILRLPRPLKALAWLPGSVLLFPRLLLAWGSRPALRRVSNLCTPFASLFLVLLWTWGDLLGNYDRVRSDMERWPQELLDPRITRLASSPPGVRADWHGVKILGEHAIVSCEQDPRLAAMSLREDRIVEQRLRPRWGLDFAGPITAEVDPLTGTVWTVDGGDSVLSLSWDGQRWATLSRTDLPIPISFATIERGDSELLITTVQAADRGPRRLFRLPLPGLVPVRVLALQQQGHPAPMPREAAWVPTIQRQVIAPDFGRWLYAVDLDSGEVHPWLEVPTLNGKMQWLQDEGLLLLALPNRVEAWLIDPVGPTIVRRIRTQPGVRAIAVDPDRSLMVSASVLTGQIWVQSLHTGEVLLRIGTVMPMVRELALSPELGIGVLTTWNEVYRFDYLP